MGESRRSCARAYLLPGPCRGGTGVGQLPGIAGGGALTSISSATARRSCSVARWQTTQRLQSLWVSTRPSTRRSQRPGHHRLQAQHAGVRHRRSATTFRRNDGSGARDGEPRLHPSLHQRPRTAENVLGPGSGDETRSWTTGRQWRGIGCDYGTEGLCRRPLSGPEVPRLPNRGLIFGLIRMRSSAFSSVRIGVAVQVAAVQVTDADSAWRTRIPSPESRGWRFDSSQHKPSSGAEGCQAVRSLQVLGYASYTRRQCKITSLHSRLTT